MAQSNIIKLRTQLPTAKGDAGNPGARGPGILEEYLINVKGIATPTQADFQNPAYWADMVRDYKLAIQGPPGARGQDGLSIRGDRGDSIVGPQGAKGDSGDDVYEWSVKNGMIAANTPPHIFFNSIIVGKSYLEEWVESASYFVPPLTVPPLVYKANGEVDYQGSTATVLAFQNWIKGKDGIDGVKGDTGESAYEIFKRLNPLSTLSESQWLLSLQGTNGAPGQSIQGPVGNTGPQGVQGIPGPPGADGRGLNFAGEVADSSALPASANLNDAYKTANDGHIWVWTTGNSWVDLGAIKGEKGDTTFIDVGDGLILNNPNTPQSKIDVRLGDTLYINPQKAIEVNTVDNLSSTDLKKPLSANQGRILNDLKADKNTQIILGTGLSGGGSLDKDVSINIAIDTDYSIRNDNYVASALEVVRVKEYVMGPTGSTFPPIAAGITSMKDAFDYLLASSYSPIVEAKLDSYLSNELIVNRIMENYTVCNVPVNGILFDLNVIVDNTENVKIYADLVWSMGINSEPKRMTVQFTCKFDATWEITGFKAISNGGPQSFPAKEILMFVGTHPTTGLLNKNIYLWMDMGGIEDFFVTCRVMSTTGRAIAVQAHNADRPTQDFVDNGNGYTYKCDIINILDDTNIFLPQTYAVGQDRTEAIFQNATVLGSIKELGARINRLAGQGLIETNTNGYTPVIVVDRDDDSIKFSKSKGLYVDTVDSMTAPEISSHTKPASASLVKTVNDSVERAIDKIGDLATAIGDVRVIPTAARDISGAIVELANDLDHKAVLDEAELMALTQQQAQTGQIFYVVNTQELKVRNDNPRSGTMADWNDVGSVGATTYFSKDEFDTSLVTYEQSNNWGMPINTVPQNREPRDGDIFYDIKTGTAVLFDVQTHPANRITSGTVNPATDINLGDLVLVDTPGKVNIHNFIVNGKAGALTKNSYYTLTVPSQVTVDSSTSTETDWTTQGTVPTNPQIGDYILATNSFNVHLNSAGFYSNVGTASFATAYAQAEAAYNLGVQLPPDKYNIDIVTTVQSGDAFVYTGLNWMVGIDSNNKKVYGGWVLVPSFSNTVPTIVNPVVHPYEGHFVNKYSLESGQHLVVWSDDDQAENNGWAIIRNTAPYDWSLISTTATAIPNTVTPRIYWGSKRTFVFTVPAGVTDNTNYWLVQNFLGTTQGFNKIVIYEESTGGSVFEFEFTYGSGMAARFTPINYMVRNQKIAQIIGGWTAQSGYWFGIKAMAAAANTKYTIVLESEINPISQLIFNSALSITLPGTAAATSDTKSNYPSDALDSFLKSMSGDRNASAVSGNAENPSGGYVGATNGAGVSKFRGMHKVGTARTPHMYFDLGGTKLDYSNSTQFTFWSQDRSNNNAVVNTNFSLKGDGWGWIPLIASDKQIKPNAWLEFTITIDNRYPLVSVISCESKYISSDNHHVTYGWVGWWNNPTKATNSRMYPEPDNSGTWYIYKD